MNNDELLEITTEIGWRLLQSGAEIYRVEESIRQDAGSIRLSRGGGLFHPFLHHCNHQR